MDDLDREIDAARQRVAQAKATLSEAVIKLEALELAASLRPSQHTKSSPIPTASAPTVKRGGKPPGSISMAWRKALATLPPATGYHSVDEFAAAAKAVGIETSIPSVRDRLKVFAEYKYLEGDFDLGMRVTEHAVEKLGLKEMMGILA